MTGRRAAGPSDRHLRRTRTSGISSKKPFLNIILNSMVADCCPQFSTSRGRPTGATLPFSRCRFILHSRERLSLVTGVETASSDEVHPLSDAHVLSKSDGAKPEFGNSNVLFPALNDRSFIRIRCILQGLDRRAVVVSTMTASVVQNSHTPCDGYAVAEQHCLTAISPRAHNRDDGYLGDLLCFTDSTPSFASGCVKFSISSEQLKSNDAPPDCNMKEFSARFVNRRACCGPAASLRATRNPSLKAAPSGTIFETSPMRSASGAPIISPVSR
mmetsp:Transcript_99274/g.265498  ORF Transcript_99274/g.265498 Transcript_99274/m.265498 type:complete len:272 (+) Transcript_99274:120-935(+)